MLHLVNFVLTTMYERMDGREKGRGRWVMWMLHDKQHSPYKLEKLIYTLMDAI